MESTYNKDLKEYFNPSGSPNVAFSIDDEDRVLGFIISIGSSYPSEISRHLLLRVEQVNAILMKLINKEYLKRLILDRYYPQALIKCRINDMWALGILGFEQFSLRSWLIATEKGFWYFADRFEGDHRRANVAYVETYPNIQLINKIGGINNE